MNCHKCGKQIYGLEFNMGECFDCDSVEEDITPEENERRYKNCMKAVKKYLKKKYERKE